MKKLLFAAFAACCLLAAFPASAQRHGGNHRMTAEEIAKTRTERMTEQLKLDDVQQQQIYRLNLDFAQKMQQLHASRKANTEGDTRQDDRQKMQELQDAYDAQLKKNLSREQYAKWSERQQQMRNGRRRPQGGPEGRRPAPGQGR